MNSSLFSLTNFYIFLVEFAFSILFLIIFSSIHYGITISSKLGTKIEKSKSWNFLYFFFFGFILALVTFIVSQISTTAFGEMGMPLTILGLIYAMTVFYNRSVQIGALIPIVLWIFYQYNGFIDFSWGCGIRLLVVLSLSIVSIGTTFIKWKPWPTFFISCFVSFVTLIVIIVSSINEYTTFFVVSAILYAVTTMLYYFVITKLNSWLHHVSRMAKQGTYVDKYYVIPNILDQHFDELISSQNLSQALVVSLSIEGEEKYKLSTLSSIYNTFKKDKALLFKSEYGTYGMILFGSKYSIKNLNSSFTNNKLSTRPIEDELHPLEIKIDALKNNRVLVRAFVSVYGIQSCSLQELLKFNHYAMRHGQHNNKNIIQLFNTNIISQEVADNIAFATLSQNINLNDIDVELELIRLQKSHHLYVCPRFYWPKILTCDSSTILNHFEPSVANTLLRSLAIKSLEQYANNEKLNLYPLLIYYPVDQINSNSWSTEHFIHKISLYGIDPSRIILSFNMSKMTAWPKQAISNLQDLEKHNIKYWLFDLVNIKGLKHLNPNGIILDESISKKKDVVEAIHSMNITIL